jgi:hypothetical protein
MSLDSSYDMVLLPPQHDGNDSQWLARWRRPPRRHLPVAEEEHSGRPRHPPRRRRRRQGNRGHAGGGTLSAVKLERVDDASTPPGDMSGVVLAPETTTSVASPQRASPKRTDDASTLAKDLLGVSLVPKMTVCSIPNYTYLKLKIPGPNGIITIGSTYCNAYECDMECVEYAEALAESEALIADLERLSKEVPEVKRHAGNFEPVEAVKSISLDSSNDASKKVRVGSELDPK